MFVITLFNQMGILHDDYIFQRVLCFLVQCKVFGRNVTNFIISNLKEVMSKE